MKVQSRFKCHIFHVNVQLKTSVRAVLTQQVWVQGQHWSQVRGGLGDDEADQIGVEAGQSVQRPGHHSSHGVTNKHHTLWGGLQVLAGREEQTELTCWVPAIEKRKASVIASIIRD